MATTMPAAALDFRPLGLGELLDRTFTMYRNHFLVFFGIFAPPQFLVIALSLYLQSMPGARQLLSPAMQKGRPEEVFAMMEGMAGYWAALFLLGVLGWFLYSLTLGAITFAVSEMYLGRGTSVRAAYRMVRPRALGICDVMFSVTIRFMGLSFLTLFVFLMLAGIFAMIVPIASAVLIPVGMVAGFLLTVRLCLRYGVCVPALLLEKLRSRQAIKRSIELTKGRLGGLFLLVLLVAIVTVAIVLVIQGPTTAAIMLMKGKEQLPLWLIDLNLLLSGLGQMVAGPLPVIALVLYYYDLRIRKEAFDLQIMTASLAPVASPADVPPATS